MFAVTWLNSSIIARYTYQEIIDLAEDIYVKIMNMCNEKTRLLILPCSKLKKQLNNVQAIELYDGPFYRIVRRYSSSNIDIIIISAKYGLISSNDLISFYDQKMTINRAQELAEKTTSRLEQLISDNDYVEIFINLGKIYMFALKDSTILSNNNTIVASGRIGERLHQLKTWLELISDRDTQRC
jgi:hypothetical protein